MNITKNSFSISKFSVIDKERAKKNDRIFGEVLIPTTHPLTEKKRKFAKSLGINAILTVTRWPLLAIEILSTKMEPQRQSSKSI